MGGVDDTAVEGMQQVPCPGCNAPKFFQKICMPVLPASGMTSDELLPNNFEGRRYVHVPQVSAPNLYLFVFHTVLEHGLRIISFDQGQSRVRDR